MWTSYVEGREEIGSVMRAALRSKTPERQRSCVAGPEITNLTVIALTLTFANLKQSILYAGLQHSCPSGVANRKMRATTSSSHEVTKKIASDVHS